MRRINPSRRTELRKGDLVANDLANSTSMGAEKGSPPRYLALRPLVFHQSRATLLVGKTTPQVRRVSFLGVEQGRVLVANRVIHLEGELAVDLPHRQECLEEH